MALHEIVLKLLVDENTADAAYKRASRAVDEFKTEIGTILDWDFEENELQPVTASVEWALETEQIVTYYTKEELDEDGFEAE